MTISLQKMTRPIIFPGIILFFMSFSAFAQPYENNFEAIPQGNSQCGPTSFYMIFNYYGDHDLYREPDCSTEIDLSEALHKVTSSSEISKWVNSGNPNSTSWDELEAAASDLYSYYSCDYYYSTVELQDHPTKQYSEEDQQERRERLDYIKISYLDKDRPVILHLRRYWWLWGHYIVLTGYDEEKDTVYCVDPHGPRYLEIDYDDFIENKFYLYPGDPGYMKARWDGEWLGFYGDDN